MLGKIKSLGLVSSAIHAGYVSIVHFFNQFLGSFCIVCLFRFLSLDIDIAQVRVLRVLEYNPLALAVICVQRSLRGHSL